MSKVKSFKPVYFKSLELDNVRCFGPHQELRLCDDEGRPARWTILLGDNGLGKSTLLQCLAWMRPEPWRPQNPPGSASDTEGPGRDAAEAGDDELVGVGFERVGPPITSETNDVLDTLLRSGADVTLELGAVLSCGQDFHSVDPGLEIRTAIRLKGGKGKLENIDSREDENTSQEKIGEYPDHLVVAYGADRYLGTANITSLYAPEQENDPIASRISSTSEMYDPEEIINHLDNAARKRTEDTPE